MSAEPTAAAGMPGPEDDSISPALRRRLQQCFQHASKLLEQEKYDFEYANKLLTDCVVNDPGNIDYVEPFLKNLQQKYNNNKRGAAFKGFGSRGSLKKLVAKEDWREILKQGPSLLASNPWDVPTLRAMAQACETLRFDDVEIRYLKNALDANPKDPDVNRHCAATLAGLGDYDQAIACWRRVEEANKNDPEPSKMMSELTIEKQRIRAGIPPSPGKKPLRRPPVGGVAEPPPVDEPDDDEEVAEDAPKKRDIKLSRRQVLERGIVDAPGYIENYLELAELLVGERRYPDAERTLTKALSASGNDPKVLHELEEVQIQRARYQAAVADRQASKDGSEATWEVAQQARENANRLELDIYHSRSERFPEDLALKFEVGVRLKRAHNYAEAIKYFDVARQDPGKKAVATIEAGECLQHLKNYEKALKCYLRAAELAQDDPESHKLSLYRAGVLATGLKQYDAALAHLGELKRLDSAYKDVDARLDKIARIRDKG